MPHHNPTALERQAMADQLRSRGHADEARKAERRGAADRGKLNKLRAELDELRARVEKLEARQ